jgi:hypothetical protein
MPLLCRQQGIHANACGYEDKKLFHYAEFSFTNYKKGLCFTRLNLLRFFAEDDG